MRLALLLTADVPERLSWDVRTEFHAIEQTDQPPEVARPRFQFRVMASEKMLEFVDRYSVQR